MAIPQELADLLDLAKQSIETKRNAVETFTEKGLYLYSKFYLRHTKECYGKYWRNHLSTIGVVGMNECCLNLIGKGIGLIRDSGVDYLFRTTAVNGFHSIGDLKAIRDYLADAKHVFQRVVPESSLGKGFSSYSAFGDEELNRLQGRSLLRFP